MLKYFYIRTQENQYLYDYEESAALVSEALSCRWPSYYSLFHWTGQYLVNGRGYFLGVEHHSYCGPWFEHKSDRKPVNVR